MSGSTDELQTPQEDQRQQQQEESGTSTSNSATTTPSSSPPPPLLPHQKDESLLESFRYINSMPGKNVRGKMIDCFQIWFQVESKDVLDSIKVRIKEFSLSRSHCVVEFWCVDVILSISKVLSKTKKRLLYMCLLTCTP